MNKQFLLCCTVSAMCSLSACSTTKLIKRSQVAISSNTITLIKNDGLEFRDLNRDGVLDPYEDWRNSPKQRTEDLISRMTVEEKVGQLLHGSLIPDYSTGKPAPKYQEQQVKRLVLTNHVTALIPFFDLNAKQFAEQNNKVQDIAEQGRLGIPVMVSTDPRHHFQGLTGASLSTEGFSRWPETLGFAAINDVELTKQFAQIASSEYRASGFSLALSPMADLSTEPRWPRVYGTFGEDTEIASRMVSAYVEGFQDDSIELGVSKVATVVKHWVGYGAASNGFDSHNYYGRYGALESADLNEHLKPFKAAFNSNVSSVMPAYSIFSGLRVNGKEVEQMGAAYSSVLLQDLLRGQHAFDGVILSDWAITNDCNAQCRNGAPKGQRPSVDDISTGWGVQRLSRPERFALAMQAGVDQFGGADDPAPLLDAIANGLISIKRVDSSVKRILERSFNVGLFDNPFVDSENVDDLVNTPIASALALQTQSRAMVRLKQDVSAPVISAQTKSIFLHNADQQVFRDAGFSVVDKPEDAELIIARLSAPFETLHPGYFFGGSQHEGSLEFSEQDNIMKKLENFSKLAPLVVDVFMDRPAILTEINAIADVLFVNFGASDEALIKVLNGTRDAQGRLPFELPSSQKAVEQQSSSKSADSLNPLFPLGYKLEKENR